MAKDKKKDTIKTIISNGIKAGHTAARILKAVKKDHPDSKADESHIRYYSGSLKRAGEISSDTHEKYSGTKGRGNTPAKTTAKKAAKAKAEKPAAKKATKAKAEKPAAKKAAKAKAEKPAAKKAAKAKKA